MKANGPRDLRAAVFDAGFSPSVRHVRELAQLTADKELGERVEHVLARLGAALAPAVENVWNEAPPASRFRLLRALGRAEDANEAALTLLERSLGESDERTRRAAASALGRLGQRVDTSRRHAAETKLLEAWSKASADSERRAIAEALGKVGGERARDVLAILKTSDAELERILGRARLVLARNAQRLAPGAIRGDVAVPRPLPILLGCRRGLERIVADELGREWDPVPSPGRVRGTLHGTLDSVWAATRVAERFAIALPDVPLRANVTLVDAVTKALLDAEPLLATFTEGPIRFRVSFASGGHQRATVWKIAEHVAAQSKRLVNDPKESAWELEIATRKGKTTVLAMSLRPRGLADQRFAYRTQDVPAASHPTIAAALARVAGARPNDVVWDPFVGSGLELIERGKLGPARKLVGSDLEEGALAAARANASAAGVTLTLVHGDAMTMFPEGTSLVISNPPMGRRVHRKSDIGDLLFRFVEHVAAHLPDEGRLVWLSPQPARTSEAGKRRGLHVERVTPVDLGGFDAELQVMTRKAR